MELELLIGVLGALSVPLVGFLWHRRRRGLSFQRVAVQAIGDSVTELFSVVQHDDVVRLGNATIAGAIRRFDQAWQKWQHELPEGSAHLRGSIRAAMGNCFGGPAPAGIDPRCESLPQSAFDPYWWNLLTSYLDHVRIRFSRWLPRNDPVALSTEKYLTWRSDEDQEHRRTQNIRGGRDGR